MLSRQVIEITTGLFLLAAIIAFLVLAVRISGVSGFLPTKGYIITAGFSDIGQLKIRSAVKINGVNVGEVTAIHLDPTTFSAVVSMKINDAFNRIPDDSSAAILTAGLLGDNYVAITPMYSQTFLKQNSVMTETHSAMILEKLIGQFLFNMNKKDKS